MRSSYNNIFVSLLVIFMLEIDLRPYFVTLVFRGGFYVRLSLGLTWLHDG